MQREVRLDRTRLKTSFQGENEQMPGYKVTRYRKLLNSARSLMLGIAVVLAGQLSTLSQSQSGPLDSTTSIPLFLDLQLEAENVSAPLGPGLSPVLSRISILARGSGFEDITRSLGLGVVSAAKGKPAATLDGEMLEVEASFDITYRIVFEDIDPENDYAAEFRTGPTSITLRLPRGQRSRVEASGMCIADTSLPNFGCIPQLVDPRDPQLIDVNDPLRFQDISFSLGSGLVATLSVPERDLVSTFIEQIPLAGNQIFVDGFESGDTTAWSFSATPAASFPQSRSTSSFTVAATGTLEIQEKVVEAGSQLVNYFSLIGEGSTSNLGFQTTMIFTNTGGQSGLRIEFFTPGGEPLQVTLAGPPSSLARAAPMTVFNTTLAPGQALSLRTVGLEDLQVGYARFTAGPSVGATAILTRSNTSTGATLFDAGVPAITRPLRRFSLFLDSLGVKDTGLAMVRAGLGGGGAATQGVADNVRLRLFDTDFNPIATTAFFLSEGAQISRFIHEYFQDQPEVVEQAQEMQGVVVVESTDLLAAITLRLTNDPGNPTLTAFPIIEGRAESSMMEALKRGGEGRR